MLFSWTIALFTWIASLLVNPVLDQGNSNMCVKHKLDLKDDDFARKINDEILPEIFDRIYEILSPTV